MPFFFSFFLNNMAFCFPENYLSLGPVLLKMPEAEGTVWWCIPWAWVYSIDVIYSFT